MPTDAKEILAQIAHHETMAEHHASTAASLRAQHQTLLGSETVNWGHGMNKRRPTKSNTRWVTWLRENGPATRKTIADAIGLLTGEIPPYADSLGLTASQLLDASYPDDMMLRLAAENENGRGRPVDIYFLWSQRWDVHPLFGVGPTQPEPMTGVIMPTSPVIEPGRYDTVPISSHPIDPEHGEEQTFDFAGPAVDDTVWSESQSNEPTRCATLEEWDDLHSASFDAMVYSQTKPTDEQKQLLRDTLPEGADGNAAIAIAYRDAVTRSRERN